MRVKTLITSPWIKKFELFAGSINQTAFLVSPFVSSEPLQRLCSVIKGRGLLPQVEILTSLTVDNLLQGITDAAAISSFCRQITNTTVRNLPHLHAKVYVADNKLAIITSANLTEAGLNRNFEYGIEITDTDLVIKIIEDIKAYGELGTKVTVPELDQLAEISRDLRMSQAKVLDSAAQKLRQEFEKRLAKTRETLMHLRAKGAKSTNTIFSRTILYLLKNGPLTTNELHPLVQQIHPDLCDDSIDRVIEGVHFGKLWKHMVRNSQQYLKHQNLIELERGKWHLVSK